MRPAQATVLADVERESLVAMERDGASAAAPGVRPRLLPRISLRVRLLLIVTGITLVALMLGAIVALHNTHEAVEDEVATNLEFARRIVDALVSSMPAAGGDHSRNDAQILRALRELRHIRTTIDYGNGRVTLPRESEDAQAAPAWFVDMMKPRGTTYPRSVIHISALRATVTLEPDPVDEINEHWRDVAALLKLAASMFVAVCVLVYFSVTRSLRPLQQLQDAYERLEHNDYDVRVTEEAAPELARINARFNHMVDVLRQASEERRDISAKLVQVQEQERRAIARELHDDMAPYLFGLRADLARIQWLVAHDQPGKIPPHTESMQQTTGILQQHVRDLLHRMRPQVLDDLGLAAALADLVDGWRQRCPEIDWQLDLAALDSERLDDTMKVTVFRAVQECLTNIAKHSRARRVSVTVGETVARRAAGDRRRLMIDVVDNGVGRVDAMARGGFGLRGMRERVNALGGDLQLSDNPGGGIKVTIVCPLLAPAQQDDSMAGPQRS